MRTTTQRIRHRGSQFAPPEPETDAENVTERVSSVAEDATIIHFSDLPDAEAALLQSALTNGSVTVDYTQGDAQADTVRTVT